MKGQLFVPPGCTAASAPLVMLLTLALTAYLCRYKSEEIFPFCGTEIGDLCHHRALQLVPLTSHPWLGHL